MGSRLPDWRFRASKPHPRANSCANDWQQYFRNRTLRLPRASPKSQTVGEIDSTFDPTDLAEFLLASWEGAMLRMKVERGPAALDRFKRIVFQTILKG